MRDNKRNNSIEKVLFWLRHSVRFKKRARQNINKNNNKIKIDESSPSFARYFWTTYDTYICFVDEFDERRPFNLHRLSIAIKKLQHKVKKVAFPQIGRWLFGKLNSGDLATGKKSTLSKNRPQGKQKEVVTAWNFDHWSYSRQMLSP